MQWHRFHITRSTGFHSSPALNRSLLPSLASKAVPSPLCLWGTVTNWKVLLNVAWFGTQGLEIPPLVKTTRLQGVELSTPTTAPVDMSVRMSTCFRYRGTNTSRVKKCDKARAAVFLDPHHKYVHVLYGLFLKGQQKVYVACTARAFIGFYEPQSEFYYINVQLILVKSKWVVL